MNATTTTQADTIHSRRSPTRATTKNAMTPASSALKGLVAPPGWVSAAYTRLPPSTFSSNASRAATTRIAVATASSASSSWRPRRRRIRSMPTAMGTPRKPKPTIRLTMNSSGPGSRATAPLSSASTLSAVWVAIVPTARIRVRSSSEPSNRIASVGRRIRRGSGGSMTSTPANAGCGTPEAVSLAPSVTVRSCHDRPSARRVVGQGLRRRRCRPPWRCGGRQARMRVVLPTPYAEQVLDLVARIPSGQVVTYGDVAGAVGGSALSVGRVMSRFGSGVPWWRVIKAGGLLPPGHEVEAARRLAAERRAVPRASRAGRPRPVPLDARPVPRGAPVSDRQMSVPSGSLTA